MLKRQEKIMLGSLTQFFGQGDSILNDAKISKYSQI